VRFGAVASASVTFNSSTSLTAISPAQAAGTVSVTVTNPDTQNATLGAAFLYVDPGPFIFSDGFESGTTGAWSHTLP
jgi:hypothetical protein